jgi:kynurenine formamidase
VARPELKLPNSGPYGTAFVDQIPPWQFGGEACVVDCRDLFDTAANGHSSLVTRDKIIDWEAKNRELRFGDVVLFRSDYSDRYYKPLPAGRRFLAEPLERKAPAWPDPDPACMEFLATRRVMTLGTDSPTMGPIPDLGEPTHYAGLKHGMIWTESATGLGQLPATGAFYCMMGPKHKDAPYGEGRAFAIVGNPLAAKLIDSARNKRAVDLTVTLSIDAPLTWPGRGVGRHRQRYTKADFLFADNLKMYHHTHILDSHAGTHLVPPAYALAPEEFDPRNYAPHVRGWLEEYENKYGPRGTSDVTTENVPLSQTCGTARVIDVRQLVDTTNQSAWPASPEITPALIQECEHKQGALKPGEIVIFHSGHVDKFFRPFPAGAGCLADPLNGKSEGWPALGADAVVYLAEKGIQCVAIDAPSLGGVDERQALLTYWALGSRGMVGVEFLTGVDNLPDGAYFLFAPVKIQNAHGGPGRAIALY